MIAVEETLRLACQLRDQARSIRSQAQDTRAHTRTLVEATAVTADRCAATLGKLAGQWPHRAARLLVMSESARRHAAGTRRRLAHHPGGGTCGSCQDQAPAASRQGPPRGPGRKPGAAAGAEAPGQGAGLPVIGEQDRIAAQLQDTVIHRVFAAGLSLQSAAGLTGDPQVRRRIEAAVSELDQVIRETRDALFRDLQQRQGRGLSQDVFRLSGQLATTASLSFTGPFGIAADTGVSARLLMVLRRLLALIGEHATPTSIDIAASPGSYTLTIDAAMLAPGSAAGQPPGWFPRIQATAARTGVSVATQPVPGGTRITCRLPITPPQGSAG